MIHTVGTIISHVSAIVMISVELAQACPNNSSDSSWLFSVVSKLIAMKQDKKGDWEVHIPFMYIYMYDLCVVRLQRKCIIASDVLCTHGYYWQQYVIQE